MARRFVKKLHRLLDKISPPPVPALKEAAPENPTRLNVKRFPVQPGVLLAVFWKDLAHGLGPCISAYIYQHEIVRFDCFGSPLGHFHVHMQYGYVEEGRIEFPEQDIDGQLVRALFELRHNLIHWQQLHPDPRVRNLRVEKDKLEAAIATASEHINSCKEAAKSHESQSQLKAKAA